MTVTCSPLPGRIVVVNERYRFPTDPIVVLVGALGVETLLARLGARRGAMAAGALGIGFAVLVTLVRPRLGRPLRTRAPAWCSCSPDEPMKPALTWT